MSLIFYIYLQYIIEGLCKVREVKLCTSRYFEPNLRELLQWLTGWQVQWFLFV
jgi:hypothetical protein